MGVAQWAIWGGQGKAGFVMLGIRRMVFAGKGGEEVGEESVGG